MSDVPPGRMRRRSSRADTEGSRRMHRLLSRAEVADRLRVSVRTVDRLRASRDLRSVRVRGRVRFDPVDVCAYLDAQGGKERPPGARAGGRATAEDPSQAQTNHDSSAHAL